MMINNIILTDTADSSLKSVDQLLDQREANENQEVEISDSLMQQYNLELFGEEESKVGVADYATQLFYENTNLDSNVSLNQTTDLFTSDLSYHQSNVSGESRATVLVVIWLLLTVIISMMIMKIIRRRRYAKKNRNRIQTAQLYY